MYMDITTQNGGRPSNDNFVFGLTSYESMPASQSQATDKEIWCVPGGDINPGILTLPGHNLTQNYILSGTVVPPSMAICYKTQKITKFAVHLLQTPQTGAVGWPTDTRIRVYWFCDVRDDGIPRPGGVSEVNVRAGVACECGDLGAQAGCDGADFLAVSFTTAVHLDQAAWASIRSWGISVTLGTNDPLIMP